jgi:hypothetical protein
MKRVIRKERTKRRKVEKRGAFSLRSLRLAVNRVLEIIETIDNEKL